jgi:hypothetical protein
MPFSESDLQLMEQLMAKPKARGQIQAVIKEHIPDAPIPEYDAKKEVEDRFMEQFKKQQEELDKLRNEVSSSKIDREWEKQSKQIKKELNWDDEKLSEFQKAFAEEFKDKSTMDMFDMAEYYDLKNRPLTPSHNPRIGPFGIRNDQSDSPQWRKDKDDPKSPMFSKNKKEKKAYFRKQWAEARAEMLERGIK